MINLIRRLIAYPSGMRRLLTPDAREIALYLLFSARQHAAPGAADVVLVQNVEDPYYFGLFGQVISSLRAQRSIRVEQYVLNSLRPCGYSLFILNLFHSRLINWLLAKKWVGLYASFCDGVGYRSTGWGLSLTDVIDLCRAIVCWRGLATKDELLSLVIGGVPVGDLVNDSYLRFKPAPTVSLGDAYLCLVIWQAYRDVRRAKAYFTRVRPKLYLTSYSTYVQHGIAVRVAVQSGVRVFSIGSCQEFAKELSVADWTHTKNHADYAVDFSRDGDLERKLAEADAALSARMSGVIDSATAYMKRSAYAESNDTVPDVRGALVVFLHDFFDSPHVYRDMVFTDFWEWICFTIETLERTNARFFLKPHPNQIDLSHGVLNELKQRYPKVLMIPPTITNKQLVQAGMVCAVTVYGSVAHEMAYMGVPTIACGDNPHISFEFCRTARNKAEYADALCRYSGIYFDKTEMHRQSLIFYYMHNLNLGSEEKALLDAVASFRNGCYTPSIDQNRLVESVKRIATLEAFNACVSRLL